MDSEPTSPSIVSMKCCSCSCGCNLRAAAAASAPPPPWPRCVKRKIEKIFNEYQTHPTGAPDAPFLSIARVEIENECAALREALSSHQQTIQELYTELEEERNAAASAANEAMSMIVRLQREKAELQMESRQFKRYAEEKMAHDQQELMALEEFVYKREQLIQALNCEIQAYRHRLLSFGYGGEVEAEFEDAEGRTPSRRSNVIENSEPDYECNLFEYPPLKCNVNEAPDSHDVTEIQFDLEKYALGDTPHAREHLQNLEFRIGQLEKNPRSSHTDGEFASTRIFLEKAAMGQSPRHSKHYRKLSQESSSSFMGVVKEVSVGQEFVDEAPKHGGIGRKKVDDLRDNENSFSGKVGSEIGDDMKDRVYTIDSVHGVACNGNGLNEYRMPVNEGGEDYHTTSSEPVARVDAGEMDIKKLYTRLQALEADRESMRQAIISMSTDKAQLVLLKEIAQQLSKDMSPKRTMPVKKPSPIGSFSLVSVVKWVLSFVFWRKNARRSKYMYELSNNNLGLLLLLEKSPQMKQLRCLSRSIHI